jgi:hypothetical protein
LPLCAKPGKIGNVADTIKLEIHEAHCPGCRIRPTQGVDPLGVMRKPFGFCVRCQKDEQYCECDEPLLEQENK